MEVMTKHRSHSAAFNWQVAEAFITGETLHAQRGAFGRSSHHGADRVEPLEDGAGETRRLTFQCAGEVAWQPLCGPGVVAFPGPPPGALGRRMQVLGHQLDDVARLVHMAALHGVSRPKLRRIACDSAFDPSMMNSLGNAASSPLRTRSSSSACSTTMCAFAIGVA